MVVEEGERGPDGEAVQPQRNLGQFHGKGVLVHPVDTALEDHAADDGLIGELRLVQDPVGLLRPFEDVQPDPVYALDKGRGISAVEPFRDRGDVLDQFGDVVGEEVHGGDEEVTAAHGRVEDFQIQDGLGGVELDQLGFSSGPGPAHALELGGFVLERLEPLFY